MQNTILQTYRHKEADLTPTLTKTESPNESLVENYVKSRNPLERKQAAQFFTPKQVALFMAGMFEIESPDSFQRQRLYMLAIQPVNYYISITRC